MTTVPPPSARPDLAAHDAAMRLSFSALVEELSSLLGARLVAYVGGVNETRAVHQWSAGTRAPSTSTQSTIRDAYVIALMLSQDVSPPVVQAWFQGLNPLLDDRSPARLLREGDRDEVGPLVLSAARAFLAYG